LRRQSIAGADRPLLLQIRSSQISGKSLAAPMQRQDMHAVGRKGQPGAPTLFRRFACSLPPSARPA
jgi:hypothetical protein